MQWVSDGGGPAPGHGIMQAERVEKSQKSCVCVCVCVCFEENQPGPVWGPVCRKSEGSCRIFIGQTLFFSKLGEHSVSQTLSLSRCEPDQTE